MQEHLIKFLFFSLILSACTSEYKNIVYSEYEYTNGGGIGMRHNHDREYIYLSYIQKSDNYCLIRKSYLANGNVFPLNISLYALDGSKKIESALEFLLKNKQNSIWNSVEILKNNSGELKINKNEIRKNKNVALYSFLFVKCADIYKISANNKNIESMFEYIVRN